MKNIFIRKSIYILNIYYNIQIGGFDIMVNYLASSKMYGNDELHLPKIIKEKFTSFDLNEDTIFYWDIEGDNIILKPRKKVTTDDILGIIDDDGEEWDIDKEVYLK